MQTSTLTTVNTSVAPLAVKEVIQTGDVFLIRMKCEACKQWMVTDPRYIFCGCGADYRKRPLIDPGRRGFRCIAGTKRKRFIPRKTIRQLIDLAENMCSYCAGDISVNFHVEHIRPLSFGGTNNISNLCLSCPRCNLLAAALVFTSFSQKRDYILAARLNRG